MKTAFKYVLQLLVAGVLAASLSCTPSGERLVPVSGRITVAGKPLTKGMVTFVPDVSKGNTTQHQPSGLIDHGNYTLYTPKARKGVPPGWYHVTVVCREYPPEYGIQGMSLIPEKYGRPETDLAVEAVDKAEPGKYDFDLQSLSQSESKKAQWVNPKKM